MVSAAVPPYLLTREAHVCVANDVVFILDSRTGKYLAIGKEPAESLGSFIQGWPVESANCVAPAILQSLIDRRLITRDPKMGKPGTPPQVQLPTAWLRDGQPRGRPDITVNAFCRFSISAAYALWSKKFLPFRYTVSRVQRQKRDAQYQSIEIEALASLVRVFDWLRPLAFRKTDECFLYCLALNEFLSKYGIHSTWIFAVHAQPFSAHCWLQYGDQALTDIPFNLRRMVPILVL